MPEREMPEIPNKWKNKSEYNAVMVQYLMDSLEELAERQPGLMTEEQIAELDSPECEQAVKSLQGVEYITSWAQRHQIPLDISGIVAIGERDFDVLLKNYNNEFGQREED